MQHFATSLSVKGQVHIQELLKGNEEICIICYRVIEDLNMCLLNFIAGVVLFVKKEKKRVAEALVHHISTLICIVRYTVRNYIADDDWEVA